MWLSFIPLSLAKTTNCPQCPNANISNPPSPKSSKNLSKSLITSFSFFLPTSPSKKSATKSQKSLNKSNNDLLAPAALKYKKSTLETPFPMSLYSSGPMSNKKSRSTQNSISSTNGSKIQKKRSLCTKNWSNIWGKSMGLLSYSISYQRPFRSKIKE